MDLKNYYMNYVMKKVKKNTEKVSFSFRERIHPLMCNLVVNLSEIKLKVHCEWLSKLTNKI